MKQNTTNPNGHPNTVKVKQIQTTSPWHQVDLTTEGGITVTAAVPSGASTGIHEAGKKKMVRMFIVAFW